MFIYYVYGFLLKFSIVSVILGCNFNIYLMPCFNFKCCHFFIVQAIRTDKISLTRNNFSSINNFLSNRKDLTHTLSHSQRLNFNYFINNRNKYYFVPYNTFFTLKTHKYPNCNEIVDISSNYSYNKTADFTPPHSQSSLYLFSKIKNYFFNEFKGWYVPPIPIGEKISYKLRSHGPVQSDEQSAKFLKLIGATEEDDIYAIMTKYKTKLGVSTSDMKTYLENLGHEYLIKFFIGIFEEIEDAAARGTDAWREFWKPPMDESGRLQDISKFTDEDKEFASWFAKEFDVEQMLRDSKLKMKAMVNIDTNRYRGLVRITSDFKERFSKCLKTMFPLIAVGLVPNLGRISIGISTILACRLIYKGDEKKEGDKFLDRTRYVGPNKADKPETLKSLATLMVVFAHSTIGYLIANLVTYFAKLENTIFAEMAYSFFINTQLTLSSLIYDTSELSYSETGTEEPAEEDDLPERIEFSLY